MGVVVGVDGAGRTFRLRRLAGAFGTKVWWAGGDLEAGLARARADGALVVVDDAHRLSPGALTTLAVAARDGVPMIISRRPTIASPELAALDEAVAAGGVEVAGALDPDEVATLVATATGRTVSPETAAAVHEASAGVAAVAAALADALAVSSGVSSGVPGGAGTRPGAGRGAGRSGGGSSVGSGGAGSSAGRDVGGGGAGSGAGSGGVGSGAGGAVGGGGAGSVAGRGTGSGGGSARVAAVLGAPAPTLVARVQRRFAVLGPEVSAVARVLALRLDLGDEVLAAAAGNVAGSSAGAGVGAGSGAGSAAGAVVGSGGGLPGALRTLRDEGMLVPDGERMIPAVAQAVLGELSAAERRRLHDSVGRALVAAGAEPVATAIQLRAARLRTPAVAAIYVRAGEVTRFADPAAALAWFDDADESGADPADTTAGRAETRALLGLPVDVDLQTENSRLARLAGAAAAHDGRTERAADTLLAADPVLAVPVLVGVGRLGQARAVSTGDRFAEAALAAAEDPDVAVPLLIEAAEAAERATPAAVLPDTPHAIGAIVAVAAGDLAAAEHLLERAAGFGGPVAAQRHRLLLAWARMRAGRYDAALVELARPERELPGRDRMLRAAIAAGVARRRGDIAGLRAVWGGVEPVLARRVVDLWQLEAAEELLVAAARLQQRRRVEPVLGLLERTVDRLGRPPAWVAALAWLRVQVGVAAGDVAEVTAQVRRFEPGAGPRGDAQCEAAALWAELLAGTAVPADTVLAVTDRLAAAQLPWEASRLTGQAAIHTADPLVARRLLERARELSEPDSTAAEPRPAAKVGRAGTLSERELAVAKLVLAGSTHREIGAQLYIAPKTVEHHVARIRSKLGAGSRAELLAVLREIVSDPG
ncbi:LuxR C-terminal-related transcriptional regulator [Actinophytocola sp.]|uniref:helix-turn-helix transcriptional regulator n=1 Tax=Actinophytocola sp. TaxID=1872138 RepID=UPI003D6BFACF